MQKLYQLKIFICYKATSSHISFFQLLYLKWSCPCIIENPKFNFTPISQYKYFSKLYFAHRYKFHFEIFIYRLIKKKLIYRNYFYDKIIVTWERKEATCHTKLHLLNHNPKLTLPIILGEKHLGNTF